MIYNLSVMSTKNNELYEENGICKWKKKICGNCKDSDPFETENYCHIAVRLYMAENNTKCPECTNGYMKINKEHNFICSLCGYSKSFTEFI